MKVKVKLRNTGEEVPATWQQRLKRWYLETLVSYRVRRLVQRYGVAHATEIVTQCFGKAGVVVKITTEES